MDMTYLENLLQKATFQLSFLVLFGVTSAATKKLLLSRTACYNFVSVKNTSLSQECIIYSPPFGWAATPYSPAKRSDSASHKEAETALVFGKPPLIPEASATICTRPNYRAAPLFPNLDGNLFLTLTAHRGQSFPHPYRTLRANTFSELAETGSRQVIHISPRVLG